MTTPLNCNIRIISKIKSLTVKLFILHENFIVYNFAATKN